MPVPVSGKRRNQKTVLGPRSGSSQITLDKTSRTCRQICQLHSVLGKSLRVKQRCTASFRDRCSNWSPANNLRVSGSKQGTGETLKRTKTGHRPKTIVHRLDDLAVKAVAKICLNPYSEAPCCSREASISENERRRHWIIITFLSIPQGRKRHETTSFRVAKRP